jgi:hypothetical protein
MGQPIHVVEKRSSRPGVYRFETNRSLSGMGHERYTPATVIDGPTPVDELARRIFARGGIAAVHVNGSVVIVDVAEGHSSDGIAEVIRTLYLKYPVGPGDEEAVASETTLTDGDAAPEQLAEPGDAPSAVAAAGTQPAVAEATEATDAAAAAEAARAAEETEAAAVAEKAEATATLAAASETGSSATPDVAPPDVAPPDVAPPDVAPPDEPAPAPPPVDVPAGTGGEGTAGDAGTTDAASAQPEVEVPDPAPAEEQDPPVEPERSGPPAEAG